MMLSMSTTSILCSPRRWRRAIAFRFGEKRFFAEIRGGKFDVHARRASSCGPDDHVRPRPAEVVVYGGAPLDTLHIEGVRRLAEQSRVSRLPPKVA
jgi:hypothetical protein